MQIEGFATPIKLSVPTFESPESFTDFCTDSWIMDYNGSWIRDYNGSWIIIKIGISAQIHGFMFQNTVEYTKIDSVANRSMQMNG